MDSAGGVFLILLLFVVVGARGLETSTKVVQTTLRDRAIQLHRRDELSDLALGVFGGHRAGVPGCARYGAKSCQICSMTFESTTRESFFSGSFSEKSSSLTAPHSGRSAPGSKT